jgi:hypothetical protein
MPFVRQFYLAMLLAGLVLTPIACGPVATPEDIPPMTVEAQSTPQSNPVEAPEATATGLPTEISVPATEPANAAEPAATGLPAEIVMPESPVSPVAPSVAEPAVVPNQPAQPVPGSEATLAAAIADLLKQTGIPADQISVDSVKAMEWPDASLGCPQEGMMYAQMITPGFLIVLTAQGQTYEYHTDQKATVVLCNK